MNNAQAKAIADAAKAAGVAPPTMTNASVTSPGVVIDPGPENSPPEGTMTSGSISFEERPIRDTGDPWQGIEAKPLAAPAIDQIRTKNPNLSFRWVNRSCGKDTPTLRYEQAQCQGFVPATPNDCVPPPGTLKDGVITFYDVILMKIDKRRLLGALKWNNQRVNDNVRRAGVIANGKQNLKQDLASAGADQVVQRKYPGKVTVYVPGQEETI